MKVKEAFTRSFNDAWTSVNTFFRNTSRTLSALYDDFNSNMKLMAHTMGLNSDQGRQLRRGKHQQDGERRYHGDGARAYQGQEWYALQSSRRLRSGMQDGAITWKTDWKSMFTTVTTLYRQARGRYHPVPCGPAARSPGREQHIQAEQRGHAREATYANLKQQMQDGLITKGQMDQRWSTNPTLRTLRPERT